MKERSEKYGMYLGKKAAMLCLVWFVFAGTCFGVDTFVGNVMPVQAAEKEDEPKLSVTKLTIGKGETYTLTASGDFDKISWKVNRKSIATITKKSAAKVVVKGVKKGTTTVIATIDGGQYKCTVAVEEPKLSESELSGVVGDTFKLSVSDTKRKVKFYSKDKSVATVGLTGGKVTLQGEGATVVYAKVGNKKYNCTVTVKPDHFWNSIGRNGKRSETEQQMAEKAEQIYKEIIKADMTDIEKLLAIHDYIVLNTAYDYQNYLMGTIPRSSYYPEGVLLHGNAVCQGYAETLELFLDACGIENKIVTGTGNGGSHAWNLVKLDDGWYHVDATWDDPLYGGMDMPGSVGYDYFCITDLQMDFDHNWKKSNYPEAVGSKYCYYVYGGEKPEYNYAKVVLTEGQMIEYREKGMILDSVADYANAVLRIFKTGESEITLLYPEEAMPDLDGAMEKIVNEYNCGVSYSYGQIKWTGEYYLFKVKVKLLE